MTQIAALLTVFNRRQKTLDCLKHLFRALDTYNESATERISLTTFLTDDGCTDGTASAVTEQYGRRAVNIVRGNGSLFWAGGMRVAWQAAIDSGTAWDYFLLLNDDTNLHENAFAELMAADDYGYQHYGQHGLTSGITCKPGDAATITYGGLNFVNWTRGRQELVQPSGTPQRIDLTHANMLLVSNAVVGKIGIFHDGYTHACADNDYGLAAARSGFPVLSTAHVCGECENDHDTHRGESERLMQMTLAERKQYINSPTHSDADYLLFVRRNLKWRYPMTILVRAIRLYCPSVYNLINHIRKVNEETT